MACMLCGMGGEDGQVLQAMHGDCVECRNEWVWSMKMS